MNKRKSQHTKTALVTGGAGFIGSHIIDRLISEGYESFVLDNFRTGLADYVHPQATLITGDVCDRALIEKIFTQHHIDVVFHLAGQASNITSFSDPHFDIDVNLKGTVNMVLGALTGNVGRFLYASSMTAYGYPDTLPVSEQQPCRPVSYYGISKYAAERFVHATALRTDLPSAFNATSFRMFNVYGPRQSLTNAYQGALAIFIGNVQRHEPITIFGDGLQSRDFIYIDDVVDAWVQAIDAPKTYQNVYNLGSGKQTTVRDMVNTVISAAGKNPATYPIVYKKERPGEQRFMQADMKKIATDLNFRPKTSLVDGLSHTMRWAS